MKLREGLYLCEWCGLEFEQQVGRSKGDGRVVVAQCKCPKCNRNVSQKTEIERGLKLSHGKKV